MIPVIPPQQAFEMLDPEQLKVGDTFTVEEKLHFKINRKRFIQTRVKRFLNHKTLASIHGCKRWVESGVM